MPSVLSKLVEDLPKCSAAECNRMIIGCTVCILHDYDKRTLCAKCRGCVVVIFTTDKIVELNTVNPGSMCFQGVSIVQDVMRYAEDLALAEVGNPCSRGEYIRRIEGWFTHLYKARMCKSSSDPYFKMVWEHEAMMKGIVQARTAAEVRVWEAAEVRARERLEAQGWVEDPFSSDGSGCTGAVT